MNETDTATALVRAATRLFAAGGYAGTSIRAITAEAGANLGAVTYHFGTKEALYAAVLGHLFVPMAEAVEAEAGGAGSALDRIEGILRVVFGHLSAHPEMPPLMLHEVAAGRAPPEGGFAQIRRVVGAIARVIEEGHADGTIRVGSPVPLALGVVALPVHLTIARRVSSMMPPSADADPVVGAFRASPDALEDIVRFVRAGLKMEGT
ncbi:MAG TPA: TetR/AcrR family transcriptional regulator [Longimicrobiales bacterium]|nr:TetR/AcrR family transcriptional regulator [Longimicrobiales bacterium]